jgi:translation initiation factor IF-2
MAERRAGELLAARPRFRSTSKEAVRRMRVYEVAKELNVSSEALVHLLREMDIPVRSHMSQLGDEHVARLRTVMERERRLGHGLGGQGDRGGDRRRAGRPPRRRRRRRSEDAEEDDASPTADAAEAIAAEAAEAAAERGAELVDDRRGRAAAPGRKRDRRGRPAAAAGPGPRSGSPRRRAAARAPASGTRAPARRAAARATAAAPRAATREERPAPARPPPAGGAGRARPAGGVHADPGPARRSRPPRTRRRAPVLPEGQGRAEGLPATVKKRRKKDKKKKRRASIRTPSTRCSRRRWPRWRRRSSAPPSKGAAAMSARRAQERREEERERQRQEEATTVRVNEFLTVAELAEMIDRTPTEIISSAFKNLGLMVTINQRLDFDQIELLLDEFGFRAIREEEYGGEAEDEIVGGRGGDLRPAAGGDRHGSRRPR